MISNRCKPTTFFTTLAAAALTLSLGASPAMAQNNDGDSYEPIGSDDTNDGIDDVWIVSKDGGETQVGGVYTTEASARKAAKRANRQARKLRRRLARAKKKNK